MPPCWQLVVQKPTPLCALNSLRGLHFWSLRFNNEINPNKQMIIYHLFDKFESFSLNSYTYEVYFWIVSLGLEIIWRHAMIANNKYFGWSGWTVSGTLTQQHSHYTFISQFSNLKLQKCQSIIEWHPFAQLRTSAWWPLDSPKLL